MEIHEKLAAGYVKILDKLGAPGTLVRSGPSATTFDKKLGRQVTTSGTPLEVPCSANVGPVAFKDAEGREVLKSVALTLEKPVAGDKLLWAGMTFTLGTVTTIFSQGVAVAYMSEVS